MDGWRVYAQGTGLKVRGGNTNMIARETKNEIQSGNNINHADMT